MQQQQLAGCSARPALAALGLCSQPSRMCPWVLVLALVVLLVLLLVLLSSTVCPAVLHQRAVPA